MALRRAFFMNECSGSKLDFLFFVDFASLSLVAIVYLTTSLPFVRRGYIRLCDSIQRGFIVVFLVLFSFLGYLDMQVAPDYSAIITVVIFLSVAFWIDTISYLAFLAVVAVLVFINFRLGLHPSVAGSELLIEVFLFSLAGSAMFYAINEMRTRAFITGNQLEHSIRELRDLSLRDPLTRLFNRRMMNDELDREAAFSKRTGNALTIMLLDIDHFKRINDSRGHSVGDVPFDGVPWPVTISIGIADNTERTIPADLRMYAAKQSGRNRYVWDGCTGSDDSEPVIP